MPLTHRLRGEDEGAGLAGSLLVEPIRGAVHFQSCLCCCDKPKLTQGSRGTQRQHALGGEGGLLLAGTDHSNPDGELSC